MTRALPERLQRVADLVPQLLRELRLALAPAAWREVVLAPRESLSASRGPHSENLSLRTLVAFEYVILVDAPG